MRARSGHYCNEDGSILLSLLEEEETNKNYVGAICVAVSTVA